MKHPKVYTGFAIALAWPETWCKQPGAWYDGLMNRLGISRHHYYRVGHAALVLVNSETGRCRYFDFGRYHTPFQFGRVRSEQTDDGLKMKTQARISSDMKGIANFEQILNELQNNAECHGEGTLHASYTSIFFEKALAKANEMQNQSPINYGPFRFKGSNCSRFVNTVIRAGKPSIKAAFKLKFFLPLTPTPISNVNALGTKIIIPKLLPIEVFHPKPLPEKALLNETLPEPARPAGLPENSKWLAGEGAGSWFSIASAESNRWIVTRFSPTGDVECRGLYNVAHNRYFNIELPYQFHYLSHCQKVTIIQNNAEIKLNRIQKLPVTKQNIRLPVSSNRIPLRQSEEELFLN